jgi:phosphoglycerol transferase MdoB-like AlkP superfamily enzyme
MANPASESRVEGRLGPLSFLGALFVLALVIPFLGRVALALAFHERVALEPDYLHAFVGGLRIDTKVACYALLPLSLLLLLPDVVLRPLRGGLVGYFALIMTLLVTMEAITPDFVDQYDVRPERLFIESLEFSTEVAGTLVKEFGAHLLLALALVLGSILGCTWLGRRLSQSLTAWSWPKRAFTMLVLTPVFFLGARGTLRHRPLNAAMVAFSSQSLVNQLALNSTFTAYGAWRDLRHERAPAELYGKMAREEVLARAAKYAASPAGNGCVPFLHVQRPRETFERPRNLVILLEESLGAEFVGCLGGKPLTPNFDALTREGLLFTRLYSTGTRTVRGIEAVISGFLPTPGSSVVKLSKSQSNFFTVAELLRRKGYATDFVYGGEAHFDNMAAFFLANGFERAFDESDYENPAFRGTWGVSDEDLVRRANELFVAHGEQPFFALVLTTTNHSPYEFPDGRIELFDEEKATRNNTVKYADFAIGEFFRLAKRERYYADTLFLVVADHDERTYGDDLIPVDKFHIPGLLIGPGIEPGSFERVASQIDLLPTVLDRLGLELEHPMLGRNLFALEPGDTGRAILQFNDVHGLLVGDRLVARPGAGAPRCFRKGTAGLVPIDDDPELIRDGLALALLPGILYDERAYHLPELVGTARAP